MITFVKELYSLLMEKYNWTPEQIDNLEITKIVDLEFGSWKKEVKEKEPLEYIDEIEGFS